MKVLNSEGIANRAGPESCVAHREVRDEALTGEVVSAFLCAGRFLALLSTLKRVVLTTSAGAGETVSQKRSALAGPAVNNA